MKEADMSPLAVSSNSQRNSAIPASSEDHSKRRVRAFAFPFGPGSGGSFHFVEEEQALKQQVSLLLRTAPGERLMRPGYGCRIHDFLFHPINSSNQGRMIHAVREAIESWEPRIGDLSVSVENSSDSQGRLKIELRYSTSAQGGDPMERHELSFS